MHSFCHPVFTWHFVSYRLFNLTNSLRNVAIPGKALDEPHDSNLSLHIASGRCTTAVIVPHRQCTAFLASLPQSAVSSSDNSCYALAEYSLAVLTQSGDGAVVAQWRHHGRRIRGALRRGRLPPAVQLAARPPVVRRRRHGGRLVGAASEGSRRQLSGGCTPPARLRPAVQLAARHSVVRRRRKRRLPSGGFAFAARAHAACSLARRSKW